MSLDTKYRPITYNDVLGQRSSIKTLKGLVSNGAGWRQSYLFAGPFGSGKTTLGRILARALLCDDPVEGEPCDQCGSCQSMINGGSTNFIEVDAATNSGKADVKKILEELNYSSFAGSRKLYLFDEAHQLSKDALDALLKPMEENSKGTMDKRLVCIFATTEPEKMRQTVLSRCAPAFIIHHVKSDTIAKRLSWVCEQENFTFDDEALSLIADVSEGHIRDCLKAIEGVASSNDKYVSVEAVRTYLHVDRNDVVCKILLSDKADAMELCEELVSNTPIGIAYERLMTAAMFAVGLGMGTSSPPPYWNKEVLKQCFEKYEYKLLEFVDQISTRPRQGLTSALLKCDVLKWKMDNFNSKIISHRTFQEQKVKIEEDKIKQSQDISVRLSVSAFTTRVNELMRTVQIEKKIETTALGGH